MPCTVGDYPKNADFRLKCSGVIQFFARGRFLVFLGGVDDFLLKWFGVRGKGKLKKFIKIFIVFFNDDDFDTGFLFRINFLISN